MARAVAESCMFCGELHTGPCGGKPKSAKVKRAPKASPPSTGSPSSAVPSTVEAVGKVEPSEKEDAIFEPAPLAGVRARPNLSTVKRVRDDADFGPALTLFADAGLMSKEDIETHRGIISLPQHRIEALIWRQVNNESVQARTKR